MLWCTYYYGEVPKVSSKLVAYPEKTLLCFHKGSPSTLMALLRTEGKHGNPGSHVKRSAENIRNLGSSIKATEFSFPRHYKQRHRNCIFKLQDEAPAARQPTRCGVRRLLLATLFRRRQDSNHLQSSESKPCGGSSC